MLDSYIKNRGTTKTLTYHDNHSNVNQVNWDADYDGKVANISVDIENNGRQKHYDVRLDNEDLANILNVPSINAPLERRLKRDAKLRTFYHNPNMYRIEIDNLRSPPPLLQAPHLMQKAPQIVNLNEINNTNKSIESLLESIRKPPPRISSPLPNEEYIVPLTINSKPMEKYTLTPKRRHRKIKTHKTHKAYKKIKSHSKTTSISKSRRQKKKSSRLTFPFL